MQLSLHISEQTSSSRSWSSRSLVKIRKSTDSRNVPCGRAPLISQTMSNIASLCDTVSFFVSFCVKSVNSNGASSVAHSSGSSMEFHKEREREGRGETVHYYRVGHSIFRRGVRQHAQKAFQPTQKTKAAEEHNSNNESAIQDKTNHQLN